MVENASNNLIENGTLRGFPGAAVRVAGSAATLKDLSITGGGAGIVMDGGGDHVIEGIDVSLVAGHGLHLAGVSDSLVEDLDVQGVDGDGLRIDLGSVSNLITGEVNLAGCGGAGLRVSGAGTAFNRLADFYSVFGLQVPAYRSTGTVRDCADGVVVEAGAANNTVAPTEVTGCDGAGVLLASGARDNVVGRYYSVPNTLPEGIQLTGIADNGGPGVWLSDANRNRITGINLHGNGAEAILLQSSSDNRITTVWTGFEAGVTPTASPNGSHGIHIRDGSHRNVVAPPFAITRPGFGGGIAITQFYANRIANEPGDGIRIAGASHENRVWGTGIGLNSPFASTPSGLGGVAGNGISIVSGSRGNVIGEDELSNQVLIDGSGGAGVLIADTDTMENEVAGVTIGSLANPQEQQRNSDGLVIRDGARANRIGRAGNLRIGAAFRRSLDYLVRIANARENGIVVIGAGGSVGTSGEREQANVLENVTLAGCPIGVQVGAAALVNDFIDLEISGCEQAGVRFSGLQQAAPELGNRFLRCEFDAGPPGGGASPPAIDAGPPPFTGVVIDAACSGVTVGESFQNRNVIASAPVGIYVDGSSGHHLRHFEISSGRGDAAAGIVLRLADGVAVTGHRVSGYGTGIHLRESDGNLVERSRLTGCTDGLLLLNSANNGIGGLQKIDGNCCSDNSRHGLVISGAGSSGNSVQFCEANRNGNHGILIQQGASGNLIGGKGILHPRRVSSFGRGWLPSLPAPNVVEANLREGIAVTDPNSTGNRISRNSISGNAIEGISLLGGNGGAIPPEGSFDGGVAAGTSTMPAGTIVQVFADSVDQGELFLGETPTAFDGSWSIDTLLPGLPAPFQATATATDPVTGSTSEFGLLTPVQPEFGLVVARWDGAAPGEQPIEGNRRSALHDLRLSSVGAPVTVVGISIVIPEGTMLQGVSLHRDGDMDGVIDAEDPLIASLPGNLVGGLVFTGFAESVDPARPERWIVSAVPVTGDGFALSLEGASSISARLQAGEPVTASGQFPIVSDRFTLVPDSGGLSFAAFMESAIPGETDPSVVGRTEDPDNDGVSNEFEWLLMGDPARADADVTLPAISHSSPTRSEIRFRRRLGTGLDSGLVVSADLQDWGGDGPLVDSTNYLDLGDGSERVEVSVTGSPNVFVRLELREP